MNSEIDFINIIPSPQGDGNASTRGRLQNVQKYYYNKNYLEAPSNIQLRNLKQNQNHHMFHFYDTIPPEYHNIVNK